MVVRLGLLGATAALLLTGAAPAIGAPGGVTATLGQVRCQDMSSLVEAFPMLQEQFGPNASRVPMVAVEVRAAPGVRSAPFEIRVDDRNRTLGTVGAGGVVHNDVSLPNNRPARIVVSSDRTVLVDRTVTARC